MLNVEMKLFSVDGIVWFVLVFISMIDRNSLF